MVDEVKPKLLANKVIFQLVRHMVSEDMPIDGRDYLAIRMVFRQCNGSWAKLLEGDQVQVELLKTVVTAWGQCPSVQQAVKRVI